MRHLSLVLCPSRHGRVPDLILNFCICSARTDLFLLQAGLWLWDTQAHFLFSLCSQSCRFPLFGSSFSHRNIWVFFFFHISKTFPWTCELYSSLQSPSRWTARAFVSQLCFTRYWYCCNLRDAFFILCLQYFFPSSFEKTWLWKVSRYSSAS